MAIGKSLLGVFLAILYYITFIAFFFSAMIAAQVNGITSWEDDSKYIILISSLFVLLTIINLIRLKLGMSLVMMKKNIRHQSIILVFASMMIASIGLIATHSIILVLTLAVIGFVGGLSVKYQIWKVFTEIRQSDHAIFRKRLKMSGIIVGVVASYIVFDPSDDSLVLKILFAFLLGYLVASFVIGFIVVRKHFAVALTVTGNWAEAEKKREGESLERQRENADIAYRERGVSSPPSVAPNSNVLIANMAEIFVFISSLVSSLLVGLVMIPFYAYVLATNKVTVSE